MVNAKKLRCKAKVPSRSKGGSIAAPEEKECSYYTKLGRVVGTIIVGDFMHNFVDGIAIGVAFLGCNISGVDCCWISHLHEVPQEISVLIIKASW